MITQIEYEHAKHIKEESPKKAAAMKAGRMTAGEAIGAAKAAEKKAKERQAAIARVEKLCGKPLADAVERGSRLKIHRDLVAFVEQDDDQMRQQAGLIVLGWPLKKAQLFRAKNLGKRHTLDDLFNRAASNGNFLTVEIDGWRVIVSRVRGAS